MSAVRWLFGGMATLALAFVVYAAVEAAGLGASWSSVERVSLQASTTSLDPRTPERPETSNRSISPPTLPSVPDSTTADSPSTTTLDGAQSDGDEPAPDVLALIGSDSRAGLDDTSDFGQFPGSRADVIVLAIREGEDVGLVSIPRDLHVDDLCDGGRHRINEALAGCGDVNGLAHLVAELENFTGFDVDHAAAVDLAGFQDVVDAIGGYELCVDHPIRDQKSGLELDAGCVNADGELTLQWLRSRHTERLVDGSWKSVTGVSDLTRNRRQREFLIDLLETHATTSDPGEVRELVEAVAPHLTIDDDLSLADFASWVWDYRDADVEVAEIPVEYRQSKGGASVLVPAVDVDDFFESVPSGVSRG